MLEIRSTRRRENPGAGVTGRVPGMRRARVRRQTPRCNRQDAVAFCPFALCLLVCFSSPACTRHDSGAPPRPYLAFVANRRSDSVVVVDLARLRVVATILVARAPEQLAVRPGARELYAVSASGTISVVAFPGLRLAKTVRIGRAARSLVFTPDGRRALVLEPRLGDIVFLDCDTLKERARVRVGRPLANLALTPDGKTLLAASAAPLNRLYFASAGDQKLLGSVEVGRAPGPMAILLDSSLAFVADTGEEKISAVDLASRQVLSHLEIGSKPGALILKPDGGELFVLSSEAATLTLIDAYHENVEQSVPTGKAPVAAVARRDSSLLYIANRGANRGDASVATLEVETRTVLSTTHVGNEPCALALTPDERFLAVADCGAASLAILRTGADRNALLSTIPVGAQPVDVVVPDWIWKK